MKKIALSALAALTLGSVAANAGVTKLYQDANGQVFTQAGEGRTLIKTPTPTFSHASKLKFDGQAFIGFKATNFKDKSMGTDKNDFEVRRGYLQTKAYFFADPKSYYRITLDLKRSSAVDGGSMVVRAKYAYVNLNDVLPFTSFEIGLAHRPWHDYEEHNSWMYRSISEILIENHNSAHLSSSADMGAMAKTRTKYLDADIGVFNGEGYHSAQNGDKGGKGLSLEWRFTGHLLGTHGHPEKNTYLDASFFGQLNYKHDKVTASQYDDLKFYGFHTVFNMPALLVSGQYVTSTNTSTLANGVSKHAGKGYSFNIEPRFGNEHQYKLFARYDHWTPKAIGTEYSKKTYIAGAAWKQNSNLEWVANITDNKNDYASGAKNPENRAYMLTAQIDF